MSIITTILIAGAYVGYTEGVWWGIAILAIGALMHKNELKGG